MIDQELETNLHMAFISARQDQHEFITLEHLLLFLLGNTGAALTLLACGANIEQLQEALRECIQENVNIVPGNDDVDTMPTDAFQRIFPRAITQVQSRKGSRGQVTGIDVLLALFAEKDSHAVAFMNEQGISKQDVMQFVNFGIRKDGKSQPAPLPTRFEPGTFSDFLKRAGDKQELRLSCNVAQLRELVAEIGAGGSVNEKIFQFITDALNNGMGLVQKK